MRSELTSYELPCLPIQSANALDGCSVGRVTLACSNRLQCEAMQLLPSTSMVTTQSWESKVCYWIVGWPQCLPSRSPVCSFGSKILSSAVSPCLKICLASNEHGRFSNFSGIHRGWGHPVSRPVLIARNTNLLTKLHLVFFSPFLSAIILGLISLDFVTGVYSGGLAGKWLFVKSCHILPGMVCFELICEAGAQVCQVISNKEGCISCGCEPVAVTVCSISISAIQHNHVFLLISLIWHTCSFSRYLNSCLALTF